MTCRANRGSAVRQWKAKGHGLKSTLKTLSLRPQTSERSCHQVWTCRSFRSSSSSSSWCWGNLTPSFFTSSVGKRSSERVRELRSVLTSSQYVIHIISTSDDHRGHFCLFFSKSPAPPWPPPPTPHVKVSRGWGLKWITEYLYRTFPCSTVKYSFEHIL